MQHKPRIAVVISHPIQHFCPQYESWAGISDVQIKVFFASALGYKKYYDPNFRKEVSWGNIRLDNFPHVFLNGDAVLPADDKLDAPTLEAELERYAPDVLLTYGYFQPLQRSAYKWAKRKGIRIAYSSDSELRQRRTWYRQLMKFPYLWNYFRHIDYFMTVGDANEHFYRCYGVPDSKFVRMHFSIDVRSYEKAFEQREALKKTIRDLYHIGAEAFVACVVGKLVPWKNQDHIIDAMELLEQRQIHMHLFVLGSGEMMDEWQRKSSKLQKSKVHFPGFINIEDLPAYYAASDVYVHPASVEPHSIAISEAIFMGCPVIISSRCGSYGPDDDVQENRNGIVYEFGNIEQLAHSLELLCRDEAARKRFSEHSVHISRKFQALSHGGSIRHLVSKISDKQ